MSRFVYGLLTFDRTFSETSGSLPAMQISSKQAHWRDLARRFAEDEVKPHVETMEKASQFPRAFMKRLGELGILGIAFPKEFGGQGDDTFSFALALSEVTRVWASLGLSIGAHMLGTSPILFAGTDAQKKKYLPSLLKGEMLGCFGLTEPGSGSDAGGGQTSASFENGLYKITGKKVFTTSASYASVYIVSVLTDKSKGKKGWSAFILEKGCPGLSIAKKEEKLGLLGSDTAGLILDHCSVPKENLLGEEGKGFRVFLQTLDAGRIGIAAWCIGLAQASLDELVRWAKERNVLPSLMEEHEFVADAIAELATKIEAAVLLTQEACRLKDSGVPYTKQASMAKYFASTVAVEAADRTIKTIGLEALTESFPVARFFRDAKLGEIGEGTSEIQKLVIAREVLTEALNLVAA